jgi:hypothetical protein
MNTETYRWPAQTPTKKTGGSLRKFRKGRFIKGPIPVDWLIAAGSLPGKAFLVGVMLWYRAGVTKSSEVWCPMGLLTRQFGLSRFSIYRALQALSRHGLISLNQHPGRCAVCQLVPTGKAETDRTGL